MNKIIKTVLSLVKVTILMIIFIIGYILFISNAGVRVKITNNTNKNLHNIEVFVDRPIIHLNSLNTLNSYNIVFDNKVEIKHNLPVIIKFDLESKTYIKKIYPYIEINDSYVLFINVNKNGKIEYDGDKLLFTINILEVLKNYWYYWFPSDTGISGFHVAKHSGLVITITQHPLSKPKHAKIIYVS